MALALGGCKKGGSRATPSASSAALLASAEAWAAARAPASAAPTRAPAPSVPSASPGSEENDGRERAAAPLEMERSGPEVDIGPAGPVVATPLGAIYRTKGDELVVAPLRRARDGAFAIVPTDLAAGAVATIAPPPAFAGAHLYWVAHGELLRRAVAAGAASGASAEVLAKDAVDGTRVAAMVPRGGTRAIAAYVARPATEDAERTARLWAEGSGVHELSPEGAGASSVALAAAGSRVVAVVLDGRHAMTPLHARTLTATPSGGVELGADVVVAVGPPPEQHTEVIAAETGAGAVALVPFAQEERSFGLTAFLVGDEPALDAKVRVTPYLNGLDPAPVASVRACGQTLVAFARPDTAELDAATELALGALSADGSIEPREVVTRERGIRHVTMAAVPGGALLVWATITRAYARALRC